MRQHVYPTQHRSFVQRGATAPLTSWGDRRQAAYSYDGAKRLIDVVGATMGLLLLAPLLPALVLLIRLGSPGAALHRRRVLARQVLKGPPRAFYALKLRTMVEGADDILRSDAALRQEYEKRFKLAQDPRVTRFGRFLRRYHLDEFPQLVNVLRGDMSLVGPRIISPPELALYGANAKRLLSVRPGLTGLWQVSDRRDASYEERVRLDMDYIARRSLAFDLAILLRTMGYLARRRK